MDYVELFSLIFDGKLTTEWLDNWLDNLQDQNCKTRFVNYKNHISTRVCATTKSNLNTIIIPLSEELVNWGKQILTSDFSDIGHGDIFKNNKCPFENNDRISIRTTMAESLHMDRIMKSNEEADLGKIIASRIYSNQTLNKSDCGFFCDGECDLYRWRPLMCHCFIDCENNRYDISCGNPVVLLSAIILNEILKAFPELLIFNGNRDCRQINDRLNQFNYINYNRPY